MLLKDLTPKILYKTEEVNIEVESITWSFHNFELKTVTNPTVTSLRKSLVDDMEPEGFPANDKKFWISNTKAKDSIVVGLFSAFVNELKGGAKKAVNDELEDQKANALEAIQNSAVN